MHGIVCWAAVLAAQTGWKEWETMDAGFYLFAIPIVFAYGIVIGSFLNVVIIRLPREESLIKRASHCMTCGAKIRVIDLIPVFSWLMLKGKCHSCGEKISPRYPIVEALNGFLYVGVFFAFGLNWNMVLMCIFTSVLVVVGFMDWDTMEIDLRVLAVILILTVQSVFFTDLTWKDRLIGAACVSVPFFLIGEISGAVIKKRSGEKIRGIELGDTFLMAVSGLYLGWKAVVPAAFIGILIAAVVGMILKRKTGESKFAFGPFLCIGLLIGAMFGEEIVLWYISRLPQPETVNYYTNCILLH
ncbi:MAG: prepilin peptidase [Oscillospiraceae bacterium]|nr:prepilin peptidase [Oscillospiraceae bacterium]